MAAVAACSSGATSNPDTEPAVVPLPAAAEALLKATAAESWRADGDDIWEVWVCEVAVGATAEVYAGLPLRLDLTPASLAGVLSEHVVAYFDEISDGAYRPLFVAGGTVSMIVDDQPQMCVDQAIAAADPHSRGVLAVANAEHGADQPGGWSNGGASCATPPCSVTESRRAVYVGASDFHPDWGDKPPMDLVEHELGHALGWPHSAYDDSLEQPHRSAIDLMSNSAAPRDVAADHRDGPDTLAINKLTAGWLSIGDDVIAVPAGGTTVELAPSTGDDGWRLAVVAVSAKSFLTVEVLLADGYDDHLAHSGVAVHLIDGTGPDRVVTPLHADAPYDDLLAVGESLTARGWIIEVVAGAGSWWTISIAPPAAQA